MVAGTAGPVLVGGATRCAAVTMLLLRLRWRSPGAFVVSLAARDVFWNLSKPALVLVSEFASLGRKATLGFRHSWTRSRSS